MAPRRPPTDVRARILEEVRDAPGIRAFALADRLGVSLPTIAYHVRRLEKEGKMRAVRVSGSVRLHPAGAASPLREAEAECALTRAKWRVARSILHDPDWSQSACAARLGVSRQAVQRHVATLRRAGLVVQAEDGTLRPTPLLLRLHRASMEGKFAPDLDEGTRRRALTTERIERLDRGAAPSREAVNDG